MPPLLIVIAGTCISPAVHGFDDCEHAWGIAAVRTHGLQLRDAKSKVDEALASFV